MTINKNPLTQILGYHADGRPITPLRPGAIATRAFIICSTCRKPIATRGGPVYGALCTMCWEKKQKARHEEETGSVISDIEWMWRRAQEAVEATRAPEPEPYRGEGGSFGGGGASDSWDSSSDSSSSDSGSSGGDY